MSKRVKVKILSSGRVPFISGTGPVLSPIWLEENEVATLERLGYRVERLPEVPLPEPVTVVPQVPAAPVPSGNAVIEGGGKEEGEKDEDLDPPAPGTDEVTDPSNAITEGGKEEVTDPAGDVTETITETTTEGSEAGAGEVVETGAAEDEGAQEEVTETTEEEEVEEIVVDDENLSADAYYNAEFVDTKDKAQAILKARGVNFGAKEGLDSLKKKVADSNPEVVFEGSEE